MSNVIYVSVYVPSLNVFQVKIMPCLYLIDCCCKTCSSWKFSNHLEKMDRKERIKIIRPL